MRSAIEYLRLLQSLLPSGPAWNTEENSTLTEFLYGEAEEFARIDQRSEELLTERSTLYTNELLIDHENDLSLPDECSEESETITERRQNVHSKFITLGQQYPQYYIDIAAAMGWVVTITEFSPFICGEGQSGDLCGDSEVIFNWLVTIDLNNNNIVYFSSGNSQAGDQLSFVSGLNNLVCKINKYKPAHTNIIFDFTGPAFDFAFSSAFDSLPSSGEDYLIGAFSAAFGLGFDVYLGGEFSSVEFGNGFRKPAYGIDTPDYIGDHIWEDYLEDIWEDYLEDIWV